MFKLLRCCAGERQIVVPRAAAGCLLIQTHTCLLECLVVLDQWFPHSVLWSNNRGLWSSTPQGGMCRKWMNALSLTGGKELWIQTKLPLQVRNSRITAQSALSLHFLCVLSASYSGVDLAFWSLHIWFCECSAAWVSSSCCHCALLLSRLFCPVRFVWGGSCLCHHSLVTALLPGLLFVWVRNNLQWRQELHGFPTWMSLFGSQGPGKEQFAMPRILIEISDNFPRAWISGSCNIIQNLRNVKILWAPVGPWWSNFVIPFSLL